MVTYGKTLGGGLPIGALCGAQQLMRRFREERPADICFARGTFNSHPYVMGGDERVPAPDGHARDPGACIRIWIGSGTRAPSSSTRGWRDEGLPVRVANLSTIWTVSYTQPSRYNWMLQYYLRAEGLALSWVGTGRLIFSLDYSDADFAAVADRFVAAARAMEQDGFWWSDATLTNKAIKRRVLREMLNTSAAEVAIHGGRGLGDLA